ncbi:methionyl-tRNA formyltransferase [Candidatus Peregrinibacteria bacterium]|nr:methionyl-tRNA formyltransferase [Candidatus Peregrinibacteria bacterium]
MTSIHSVVFFGTPDFAVPSLEALVKDPAFDVRLVVTQPDKRVGRKKILTEPPVKIVAEKHGIKVLQPVHIRELEKQKELREVDFFVIVAYGQIFSQELLAIPKIAAVNLHASLLPRWRGASPIQHAILAGDKETGVTLQQMVRELDAGPVLGQKITPVGSRATFLDLYDRLKLIGADLLTDVLRCPLRPVPQDPRLVTMCTKLSRSDGIVDLGHLSAEEIDTKVRAFNPWPGVICDIHGVSLKLIETSLEEFSDAYALKCVNGSTIHLVQVQEPGKRVMSGAAWMRGKNLNRS